MCEVMAYISSDPQDINDLLGEFFSHADSHPHGWGLAERYPYGINLEKEPVNALESSYLKNRLEVPIVSPCCIAHIRYATKGDVQYTNCHPFLGTEDNGNQWIFAHNGTIFETDIIHPFLDDRLGTTDSEAVMLYLINAANKVKKEDYSEVEYWEIRFAALEAAILRLSYKNKLNLVFNDGTLTYVHTNFLKQTLYIKHCESDMLVSTTPLSDEGWDRVPLAQLIVYRNTSIVYRGIAHNHVYVENEADLKHLYQEYAML